MPAKTPSGVHRTVGAAVGIALMTLAAGACTTGTPLQQGGPFEVGGAPAATPDGMENAATESPPPATDEAAELDRERPTPHARVVDGQIVVPDRSDTALTIEVRPPDAINVGGIRVSIIDVDDRSRPAATPTPAPPPPPTPDPTPRATPEPTPSPSPTPPPETCGIVIEVPAAVLEFAHDSAVIEPAGLAFLENLADELVGALWITVVGHASSDGTETYNLRLSRTRAEAVATVLQGHLGTEAVILADGRGELEPVVDNDTAAGRARNRRVDVTAEVPKSTCDGLERS